MESINKFYKILRENIFEIFLSIFALLSFVPNSYPSIAFFIVNILYFKKYLKATWMFFNIAMATTLIYWVHFKPQIDKMEKEIFFLGYNPIFKENSINSLNYYNNKIIEFKKTHSFLPNKLSDIQNGYMNFQDMSYVIENNNNDLKHATFYYEKIDTNRYFLLGVGFDGEPKTNDDLLPQIAINDTVNTNLVKYTLDTTKSNDYIKITE